MGIAYSLNLSEYCDYTDLIMGYLSRCNHFLSKNVDKEYIELYDFQKYEDNITECIGFYNFLIKQTKRTNIQFNDNQKELIKNLYNKKILYINKKNLKKTIINKVLINNQEIYKILQEFSNTIDYFNVEPVPKLYII